MIISRLTSGNINFGEISIWNTITLFSTEILSLLNLCHLWYKCHRHVSVYIRYIQYAEAFRSYRYTIRNTSTYYSNIPLELDLIRHEISRSPVLIVIMLLIITSALRLVSLRWLRTLHIHSRAFRLCIHFCKYEFGYNSLYSLPWKRTS